MGVRVLVRVAMAVSATAGRPGGRFASGLQSCQVLLHRLDGIGEVRGDRDDSARRHAGCKALAERSGNNHIDRVERMRTIGMELVHRQLFRKIEAIDFDRFAALGGLVHEEPTGPARMRRNGAKVLAGDGDLHLRLTPRT